MGGSRKSAPGGRAGSGDEQGGQVDTSAVGASRGAEGAEGGRAWDGVPPSPMGRGLGGGRTPSPENFWIFDFKLAYFYGF